MTKNQFEYLYKTVNYGIKQQGDGGISRREFKQFIALMGVEENMDIKVHEFAEQLLQSISDMMLAQKVNLEE